MPRVHPQGAPGGSESGDAQATLESAEDVHVSVSGENRLPEAEKRDSINKKRKHGFQRPWDELQVAAWSIVLSLIVLYTVFETFIQPYPLNAMSYSVGAISLITIAMFIYMTISDASDPNIELFGKDALAFLSGVAPEGTAFCSLCDACVHTGSKHCRRCNKCIIGFDHHCKWLNNCIGQRNYKVYFLFIWVTEITLLLHVASKSYIFYSTFTNGAVISNELRQKLHAPLPVHQAFLALCIIVCLAAALVLSDLVLFHVKLVWRGETTYNVILAKRRAAEAVKEQSSKGDDTPSSPTSISQDKQNCAHEMVTIPELDMPVLNSEGEPPNSQRSHYSARSSARSSNCGSSSSDGDSTPRSQVTRASRASASGKWRNTTIRVEPSVASPEERPLPLDELLDAAGLEVESSPKLPAEPSILRRKSSRAGKRVKSNKNDHETQSNSTARSRGSSINLNIGELGPAFCAEVDVAGDTTLIRRGSFMSSASARVGGSLDE